jgi:hypothetical protein
MNYRDSSEVCRKRTEIPLLKVAAVAVLLVPSAASAQFVDPPEPGHICVNCGGNGGGSSGESPAERARERREREEEWKRKQAELERRRQEEERRQAEKERERRWKEAQHGIIAVPSATVSATLASSPTSSTEFFGIRNNLKPSDMPVLYVPEKRTAASQISSEDLRRAAAILRTMCPNVTTDQHCVTPGSNEDSWFLSDQLGRALTGEPLAVEVQPVRVAKESDLRAAIANVNKTMDELQVLDEDLNSLHSQIEISRTAGDENTANNLRKQYEARSESRRKKLDELKKTEGQLIVIVQMLPAR